MPPKRKASDMSDSDEDEPAYGKQILPVANLPGTFNGEPEDGLQYLFTVRREFNRLPHITRVPNPYELPPAAAPPQSHATPRGSRLPSPEWRTSFEKHFQNFRGNLTQSPTPPAGPSTLTSLYTGGSKLLPDKKDRDCWWAFLKGEPESQWNPPKRPKVDKERRRQHGRDAPRNVDGWTPVQPLSLTSGAVDGEAGNIDGGAPAWQHASRPGGAFAAPETYSVLTGADVPVPALATAQPATSGTPAPRSVRRPPELTPKLLHFIDHRYAVHILMYLTHWIDLHLDHISSSPQRSGDIAQGEVEGRPSPHPIAPEHLRWAFVLLTRVDALPSADEMATLRALARACIGLIKDRGARPAVATDLGLDADGTAHGEAVREDRSFVAGCWMVVAAVAGVWAQRDLWMDAEDSLAAAT